MAWEDRAYNRSSEEPPRFRMSVPTPPPMTIGVMAACLFIFLIDAFGGNLREWGFLSFQDGLAFKQPWRWITYQYLHGNAGHIFWNMLGVYFFLSPLERHWGWQRALAFYTLGGIAGGVTYGLLSTVVGTSLLIGASGSVLAALGACAYLFPHMVLIIIPIRVAAVLYGVFFLLSVAADRNLGDAAHLGGLVFGFFIPYYGRNAWTSLQFRWQGYRTRRDLEAERDEHETVDRILDKVRLKGMSSLTWGERRALKKATEHQRRREREKENRLRRAWR